MKIIKYNENNLNAIVEKEFINEIKFDEELNIPIDIYIKVEIDDSLQKILKLIKNLRYMMYSHIYEYMRLLKKISKTSTFERIQKLEELGMINTYTLNNNKYATLSKRGLIYLHKDNKVQSLREPKTEALKKAVYFAEYLLKVRGRVTNIEDLQKYKKLYSKIYSTLKEDVNFEKKDPDFEFKNLKLHQKKLRHIKLREDAEKILRRKGYSVYFSAKDYLEEELSYLNTYLKKSKEDQRTTEKDELSTMQNQYIYYTETTKKNILKFVMFDFGRTKTFYKNTLLHIDRIIRRMHQYIEKDYYTWEVTIYTDSKQRQEELQTWITQLIKGFQKYRERANKYAQTESALSAQKVAQIEGTFYLDTIIVDVLNISKFFRSVVRDKELVIQDNEIDLMNP